MGELPPTVVFSRTVSRGAIARKLQCRKVALRTRKGSTLGRFRDYANQRDKTNPQRSTLLSLPHEQSMQLPQQDFPCCAMPQDVRRFGELAKKETVSRNEQEKTMDSNL